MRYVSQAPREAPSSQVWLTIGLVACVLLFTGALFGTVLVNAAITVRSQANIRLVSVAARQSELVQRISKDLLQIQLAEHTNQAPLPSTLGDVSDAAATFDQTLKAFMNGGSTTDLAGAALTVAPLKGDAQVAALAQAQNAWSPLRQKIASFTLVAPPVATVDDAASYAVANGAQISNMMSDIALSIERTATQGAKDLTFIRNLLIGLAVLCVVAIVGILFTRVTEGQNQIRVYASSLELRNDELAESTTALAHAKRGTDLIMETVRQGLLLIRPDYRIEAQYSRELEEIFRMKDLAGHNLLNILQRILTERMYNTSRDYLGLLFDAKKKERAVLRVNPLDEVEVNFPNPEGGFISKYLGFSFRRIVQSGEITRVFIAVTDVTGRVQLERQLRESEHKKERQFELLLGILHVDPRMLDEFIAGAQTRTREMNDALKAQDFAAASAGQIEKLRQRLDIVFRCVHNIKGNAALLNLEYFQKTCDTFEQKIVELRNRPILGGDDFLSIVIAESDLRADIAELQDLREKLTGIQRVSPGAISAFGAHVRAADGAGARESGARMPDEVVVAIRALAQSLAIKLEKDVRVVDDGFDTRALGPEMRRAVRDVLVQLTRNSLAHGVETAQLRETAGKPAQATILIRGLASAPNAFAFSFRDDGRGLDPAAIRKRALELGLLAGDEAVKADESQVARYIFAPGFTTSNGATTDAGRGVGMDVVKHVIVDEWGGEIGVSSDPGQYCEFTFSLPIATTAAPAGVA
ncbi:MAG: Hpt domain-containing protein [Candidatus Eremiobacteraeota bacterium]|nr:Hpt domain-containing protein [Candidatus Eremiobacteraeota bacterium]MBV8364891.1 Hpt domain-containing protein [Candidatus Eremiobacteraeota bacterium]